MFKENELARLQSIQKKLNDIGVIVDRHGSIINALLDVEGQPAILMLLVAIAEQFNKLKSQNSNLLDIFEEIDLKGIADTRTFIAHDYDGVNLQMIETALRNRIPILTKIINSFFSEKSTTSNNFQV